MRLYTGTGDDGFTYCVALGKRIPKDSDLMEFLGTLDEANSSLGLARSLLPSELRELDEVLSRIQRIIFDVGFSLTSRKKSPGEEAVKWLEEITDRYSENIDLKGFVLPGGPPPAAALHLARTIIRRAERRLVRLMRAGEVKVDPDLIKVLNRMSDSLFALALHVTLTMGGGLELV